MSHSHLSFRLGSDLSSSAAKVSSCSHSHTLQYFCRAVRNSRSFDLLIESHVKSSVLTIDWPLYCQD